MEYAPLIIVVIWVFIAIFGLVYIMAGLKKLAPVEPSQITINIVCINEREERHYRLTGETEPEVIYTRGRDSISLVSSAPRGLALQVYGRQNLKLLREALNDIHDVDKTV